MRSLPYLIATAIIWTALAYIATSISSNGDVNFIELAVVLGIGFMTTTALWDSRKHEFKASQSAANSTKVTVSEKPKRDPAPVNDWLSTLDDAELNALERALAARHEYMDEDQQIELNRLLADQETSVQKR